MAAKILSVDDELDLEVLLTQYFRRQIRKGEYEFAFAHNGLEALQKLLETPDFDIILSDINMPEMDGLTLLAKINELKNPAMKCIMVSAYGDMDNIRSAMNKGAFDFATKPIDLEDLSRTIEKQSNKSVISGSHSRNTINWSLSRMTWPLQEKSSKPFFPVLFRLFLNWREWSISMPP